MEKSILYRIENQVRGQLFGGFILAMALLMIMNSFGYINLVQAGNQNDSNVSINITSGTFSVDNAPTQMNFPTQTYPSSNNIECNQEFDNIAVTDYRGTGTGWNLIINATDLTNGGATTIDAEKMRTESNASVVAGTTNANVSIGNSTTLNDTGDILMAGDDGASGINTYFNGKFFLNLDGSETTAEYTGTVYYTLA